MIIQSIPVSDVNPAPYNPRKDLKPSDREYQKLKKSIETFDLVEPLVWNKRTGNLVGGHQRFKIIKDELKSDTVEVSVVDLDEKKEKALNIALNKISGEWDFKTLKELLVELDDGSFDLSLTGFDELELKELIDYEGKAGLTDDDDAPAKPKEAKTVRGDVYQMGNHRLVCGDATSVADVDLLMNGMKADLVFTDPPYNVDYKGRTTGMKIMNDSMASGEFMDFLASAFGSYLLATKEGSSFYVFHNYVSQSLFEAALNQCGLEITSQIVWAKNVFSMGSRYRSQHELCFYAHRHGVSGPWYGDKSQTTLWNERRPRANDIHPTMKPVELIQRALMNSSKAGDIVVDLFGGSGSTMIACEKTGRTCYSMELDPGYCDVIVERWEKFTGQKATLLKESVAV